MSRAELALRLGVLRGAVLGGVVGGLTGAAPPRVVHHACSGGSGIPPGSCAPDVLATNPVFLGLWVVFCAVLAALLVAAVLALIRSRLGE